MASQGSDSTSSSKKQTPSRISRRRFFKRLAAFAAVPAVAGIYARQIEPFWPEYPEITIPIPNLPKSFENYRIAQLSDLHAGRVPFDYLQRVVARIKQTKPDLIAFTGDLVHHTAYPIADLVQMLGTFTQPVIVSYGNHEYGVDRGVNDPGDRHLPAKLQAALKNVGCHVLRNRSMPIEHDDGRLWLVGLDDLWFGGFDADKAFAGVPKDEPSIALSHNPDTAAEVDAHGPALILAGHTHGGQVRLPLIGAPYLNIVNKRLDEGLYHLPNSKMYVSRGVGYIRQIRFYCRPEAPTFRLVRA